MSNIGKYMWGESENYFDSDVFDTIEECKNDIAIKRNDIGGNYIYIGLITREFDFNELAKDVIEMAFVRAGEFDSDASIYGAIDLRNALANTFRNNINIREFKVRTIEKVKLEDLL
jgi:hypothetical protein